MAKKQTAGQKKRRPVTSATAQRKIVPAKFEKVASGGKKNKVTTPTSDSKVRVVTNDIIVFQNTIEAVATIVFLPSVLPAGATQGEMKLLDPVNPSEEIGINLGNGYRYVTLAPATKTSLPTVSFIASYVNLPSAPTQTAPLKRGFVVIYTDDPDGPIALMSIKLAGDPEIIIEG